MQEIKKRFRLEETSLLRDAKSITQVSQMGREEGSLGTRTRRSSPLMT